MSSVEVSSLVESKLVPSIGSTYEPEPWTRKETLLHPSKFPIKFEDDGNTSKLSCREKRINEVPPNVEPSKEWLMEVKRSYKAIQILSPSTTIPCSLRETNIGAQHNPIVRTSIMSEFLAKNLLGNMPLVPTNKLFKSPLGLFFECCGIARVMPIIIDTIKVFIDFHIFAILEFDLLIGYPLDKLFKKTSHGSHDEKFGITASAIHIFYLEIPMAKHYPNQDQFKEVKFISPFISPKLAYETERSSSPSLEPKPCRSSHLDVVLNNGRDLSLILHDISLENKNFCAMDISKAPTLETKEHESFSFETCNTSSVSSIIALHLHEHKHASFMFIILCDAKHVIVSRSFVWLTSCDT
jgi:hypothetical protein